MFVLLYPMFAHGEQSTNAEVQAFKDELDARAAASDWSFNEFQEILLRLLEQEQLRTYALQRIEQGQIQMPEGEQSDLRKHSTTDRPKRGMSLPLNYGILIIGIIALAAIVIFFLQKVRVNLISDVEDNATQGSESLPITEKAALHQAQKFEQHSDFREAIRALYLAILLHLHERGVLSYDKSLTNREYLRELKTYPVLQKALQPIVHIFDDVWYGYKPCGSEMLTQYRGLVQKVYEVQR